MANDVEVTVTVPGDLVDQLRGFSSPADVCDKYAADPDRNPIDRGAYLLTAAVKRTLQVDDPVECERDGRRGVVKALDADVVWVLVNALEGDFYATYYVNDLKHRET